MNASSGQHQQGESLKILADEASESLNGRCY